VATVLAVLATVVVVVVGVMFPLVTVKALPLPQGQVVARAAQVASGVLPPVLLPALTPSSGSGLAPSISIAPAISLPPSSRLRSAMAIGLRSIWTL